MAKPAVWIKEAPEEGLYWTREKGEPTILKNWKYKVRCWDGLALCGPVELGEPLKRRPHRDGWYVVKDGCDDDYVPALLVHTSGGCLLMGTNPVIDYWGIVWKVRNLSTTLKRKMKLTWYGPFEPPKEEGDEVVQSPAGQGRILVEKIPERKLSRRKMDYKHR